MTKAGYERLQQELKRLKSEDRPRIVREIEEARAHGDISENAEYHAAKERQSHVQARIALVEDRMARAQIIDPAGEPPDTVRFGVQVVLWDTESGDTVIYTLVGEDESDVARGRISVVSPVARALLGRRMGDEVTVRVPKGTRVFEVREIRFGDLD
jgi:transcription elongation factor GreA